MAIIGVTMKKIFISLLLAVSFNSFAECDVFLEEVNTCVEYNWTEGPYLNVGPTRDFSELSVKFFDADDASEAAIDKEFIEVLPWMIMPNMQHGTRPVVTTELNDGSYLISKILMRKMMGYWEIRFIDSRDKTVLGSFKVQ